MNISHSKLETARNNPKSFKRDMASEGHSYGMSRYRGWQLATRNYHKNNNELQKATIYLIECFEKNFVVNKRSEKLLEDHISKLRNYINDFCRLKHQNIEVSKRIEIPIKFRNFIKGEIPRIDFKLNGGYAVYLFIKEDVPWESELRFPIIQDYYANEIGCSLNEVSVGVYCFESEKHVSKIYSKVEVGNALTECYKISKTISVS
ncbi:MAG: hypothetical protein ACUZ8N_12825 [Candidatus Scalindua sp.]